MNNLACESCEALNATDVIPCEPAETEDNLGTTYVSDDLAEKALDFFNNKTALDHVLSFDDIYGILCSRRRRLLREEIMEQGWNKESETPVL
jgi:hypothetical protein